jgi:hypothetical protein
MTTQYTSGPWSVEIDHHTAAPEFIRAYVDGEMYDLASVLCDETGNAAANARLIAAAPELFAALEQAYYSLKLAAVRLGLDESTEFYKDIDAAYSALQKAKGEPA